jgi:membrane-associated HD superfamily phosphohydrolase
MQSGIKEEYLQSRVTQINTELMSAIHGFSQGTQRLGMNIVSTYLEANFIYDEEATEAARDQAEAAVANVVYKKGSISSRRGIRSRTPSI